MKTLRFLRVLALLVCASFAPVSCFEEPDEPEPPKIYTMTVSPAGPVTFPAEGGSEEFTVKTDADRTGCTYPSNDWLTVAYDKASDRFTVTVGPNDSGSDREFQLTFYGRLKTSDENVVTKVVKAVQPALKAVSVSATPSSLEFPAEGGELSTVVSWSDGVTKLSAVRSNSIAGWATVEWKNADGKKFLAVQAQPNDTGEERSGFINIYVGLSSEDIDNARAGKMDPYRAAVVQVTVTQPAIQATAVWVKAEPATLEFSPEGETLKSVITWSSGVKNLYAARDNSIKSWLSLEWNNEGSGKSLYFTATANDSGKERSGIVKVYSALSQTDLDDALAGNMNPYRAAVVEVTVKQPAKGDVPAGAGNGVFTVDSKGKTVRFSLGNLQYQASTKTWRFAEHQWDFVGGTTPKNATWGNVSGSSNNKVSSTYAGWIDLFCWGTSGWNSGAKIYSPEVPASTVISDSFYPGGSASNNLTGKYANADWGVYNAISNGGNKAGLWRTLTGDEWDYIIQKRQGSRYAHAKVNGVNGVILLPDGWKESTYKLNNINKGLHWNSKVSVVSATDWEGKLEPAGCIFLPNAGQRSSEWDYEKSHVAKTYFSDWDAGENGLEIGMYWSSTVPEDYGYDQAYYLGLGWQGPGVTASDWCRAEAYSVRLVQDK